jgi:DNA-binding response OmpR family regulator
VLAAALEGFDLGPAIVTTELEPVAALRAAHPGVPLVFVAVRRAQIAPALDAGADTALLGAWRAAELRARLRAVGEGRRTRLSVGPLELDAATWTARLDGVTLALAPGEFALLRCLASAPGRVFSKRELAGASSGRALDRRLARLRLRLGSHGPMLVTVWGVGYRLGEPA